VIGYGKEIVQMKGRVRFTEAFFIASLTLAGHAHKVGAYRQAGRMTGRQKTAAIDKYPCGSFRQLLDRYIFCQARQLRSEARLGDKTAGHSGSYLTGRFYWTGSAMTEFGTAE
jgi:hypothetical protein